MSKGYFGIGIYHCKTEHNVGTLMRSAQCFGASFIYTIGRRYKRQASDTMNASCNMPCYNFQTLDDLRRHLPSNCPLIGVELADNAEEVGRYCHPRQCCYLLGAEDHGLPPSVLAQCHRILIVPHTKHCLNVSIAGSIVMFDRVNESANRRINQRVA